MLLHFHNYFSKSKQNYDIAIESSAVKVPNSTLNKPSGHCFLIHSIFTSLIGPVLKVQIQMLCQESTVQILFLSHSTKNLHPVVSWEIEELVKQSLIRERIPNDCPPSRLFVVNNLRSTMIHWAHESLFACRPGVKRTVFLVTQRFWWPSFKSDWLNMFPRVRQALGIKGTIKLQADYFSPYLFQAISCHTSLWTLLPSSLSLRGIQLS